MPSIVRTSGGSGAGSDVGSSGAVLGPDRVQAAQPSRQQQQQQSSGIARAYHGHEFAHHAAEPIDASTATGDIGGGGGGLPSTAGTSAAQAIFARAELALGPRDSRVWHDRGDEHGHEGVLFVVVTLAVACA